MYRGETSAVLTERKCVGCGRCSSRRLLQSHLLCFPRHKDTRCTMMWVWAQEVVVLCSKRTHNSLKSPSSRFLPPQLRMHGRTSVLAVLPLPRHSKSAAADLAASHRALDAFVLLIEGARTYASGISMGAVAGFVRCFIKIYNVALYTLYFRVNG